VRRDTATRTSAFLLLGSLLALAVFAALATALKLDALGPLDARARAWTVAHPLHLPERALELVGVVAWVWTLLPALGLALVVMKRRGWRRQARALALATLGGALLAGALKYAFARRRPGGHLAAAPAAALSFPSGHALLSVCFYGTLAALLAAAARRTRVRALVGLAWLALEALIGCSRVYAGNHHASDVIAGWAAGLAWTLLVLALDGVRARGRSPR
jgi:undecaprenyl-diphosphatase